MKNKLDALNRFEFTGTVTFPICNDCIHNMGEKCNFWNEDRLMPKIWKMTFKERDCEGYEKVKP